MELVKQVILSKGSLSEITFVNNFISSFISLPVTSLRERNGQKLYSRLATWLAMNMWPKSEVPKCDFAVISGKAAL